MAVVTEQPITGDRVRSVDYRSVAAIAPLPSDLERLVGIARTRNRSLGVTSMLLQDGGDFFQPLEGPPAALDRVWSSVQRDPHHCGIEVLRQHIVPARPFSGRDLQLDSRHAGQPCPRPRAALGLADAMMVVSAGGRLIADATAAALRAAGTSVRLTRLI